MKDSLLHIIRGQFLINQDALKTWKFILFLSALAMIMISSAHRLDKKVHRIAALSEEVKQLKSQFKFRQNNKKKKSKNTNPKICSSRCPKKETQLFLLSKSLSCKFTSRHL